MEAHCPLLAPGRLSEVRDVDIQVPLYLSSTPCNNGKTGARSVELIGYIHTVYLGCILQLIYIISLVLVCWVHT